MSEEKEKSKGKAVTTDSIILDETANENLRKSQAGYKGNDHSDRVDITILKDGNFYKKGQKDSVHPSLAAILKEKGLIDSYKGEPKA